jgi:hypothetical protein
MFAKDQHAGFCPTGLKRILTNVFGIAIGIGIGIELQPGVAASDSDTDSDTDSDDLRHEKLRRATIFWLTRMRSAGQAWITTENVRIQLLKTFT